MIILLVLVLPMTLHTTANPIPQSRATSTIFSDNFDDGDLVGWTITTQGSGIIQISGSQYHSAPYSMRMYSPPGTSSLAMATNQVIFNPATTDYNVSFYFRLTSTPNHWFDVFVNTPQILTVIDSSNVFTYRYNSTNQAIMTLNQNQWYHIQYTVHVRQSNYGIYVDGVYKTTAPFCGGSGNPQTFTVGDTESGFTNYGEAYWDDFVIMPLVMNDDFNDNDLFGWEVTTMGSGIIQTTGSQYHSSPYSMHMKSPFSPASEAMATYQMSILDITKNYNVSLYFYLPSTLNHWFDVFTNPPHTTTVIDTQNQYSWYDGSTAHLITTLITNQWYHIELKVHPSQNTYDIYLNGAHQTTATFTGGSGSATTFRVGDFEAGSSNYGEAYYDDFIISQNNYAPNTPNNPNPTNNTTGVSITPTLSWTGGDSDGDPVTYDVYFGTTSSPPKVIGNQTGTSDNPGTLAYGSTYYWKIVSWDNHGIKTVGPLWSFTTTTIPLHTVFLAGFITDKNDTDEYVTFKAVFLIYYDLGTHEIKILHDGEQIMVSKNYTGFSGAHFILGVFQAAILSEQRSLITHLFRDRIKQLITQQSKFVK